MLCFHEKIGSYIATAFLLCYLNFDLAIQMKCKYFIIFYIIPLNSNEKVYIKNKLYFYLHENTKAFFLISSFIVENQEVHVHAFQRH